MSGVFFKPIPGVFSGFIPSANPFVGSGERNARNRSYGLNAGNPDGRAYRRKVERAARIAAGKEQRKGGQR